MLYVGFKSQRHEDKTGETGLTATSRQRQFPLTTCLMEAELVTVYESKIILRSLKGHCTEERVTSSVLFRREKHVVEVQSNVDFSSL